MASEKPIADGLAATPEKRPGPEAQPASDGGALRRFARLIRRAVRWLPRPLAAQLAEVEALAQDSQRLNVLLETLVVERQTLRNASEAPESRLEKEPTSAQNQKEESEKAVAEIRMAKAVERLRAGDPDWADSLAAEARSAKGVQTALALAQSEQETVEEAAGDLASISLEEPERLPENNAMAAETLQFEAVRRAFNEEREENKSKPRVGDIIFGGGPWLDGLLSAQPAFMARLSDWLVENHDKHKKTHAHEWMLACALTEKAQDLFTQAHEKAPLLALANSKKGLGHPEPLRHQASLVAGGDLLDHAFDLGEWDVLEAISRADWRKMDGLKSEEEDAASRGFFADFYEGAHRHEIRVWAYGVSSLKEGGRESPKTFERAWERVTRPWNARPEANSAGAAQLEEGATATNDAITAQQRERALATSGALMEIIGRVHSAWRFYSDTKAAAEADKRDQEGRLRAMANFSDKLIAEGQCMAAMALWLSIASKIAMKEGPFLGQYHAYAQEEAVSDFLAAAIKSLSKTPKENDAQALGMLAAVHGKTRWAWSDQRIAQEKILDDFAWNCAVGAWGKVRAGTAWPSDNTGSHAKEAEIISLQSIVDDSKTATDPISGELLQPTPKHKSRRL